MPLPWGEPGETPAHRKGFQTERRVPSLGLAAACLSSSDPNATRPVVSLFCRVPSDPTRQLHRPDFIPRPKRKAVSAKALSLFRQIHFNKIKAQSALERGRCVCHCLMLLS